MLVLNIFDGKISQMSCVVTVYWNKSVVSDPIWLADLRASYESHFQGHSELCIAPQGYQSMSVWHASVGPVIVIQYCSC